MLPRLLALTLLPASLAACATTPDEDVETDELAAMCTSGQPVRIQAGSRLVLLGVTSDQYAIYWDHGTVYATALRPGAPRQRIVDAAAPPLAMVSSTVALVWPGQGYFASPATPGRLVAWTAAHGAHPLSEASMPPVTYGFGGATSIAADGRRVTFTTGVDSASAIGDVAAAGPDGSRRQVVATSVQVTPYGACAPMVDFRPGSGDRDVIIAACGPADATATLTAWHDDKARALATDLATPPSWSSDDLGRWIYTTSSTHEARIYDRAGTARRVHDLPTVTGWIARDGEVFTLSTRGADGSTRTLRRTTPGGAAAPIVVSSWRDGTTQNMSHLAQGLTAGNLAARPTTPDGRFLFGWTQIDPNTGLVDANLVDTTRVDTPPVVLDTRTHVAPVWENHTRDSRHMLYITFDVDTGAAALVAADPDGRTRVLTTGNPTGEVFPLHDSVIAYSDRAVGDSLDPLSTTDIVITDLERVAPSTTAVAGAYNLFFTDRHRRSIVYTSDHDAARPGLYVVPAGR